MEQTLKLSVTTAQKDLKHVQSRKNQGLQTYNPATQVRTYFNRAEGIKNPRWREQIILGQNATTPLEGVKWSLTRDDPIDLEETCYLHPAAPTGAWQWLTQVANMPPSTETVLHADLVAIPVAEANSRALSQLTSEIRDKRAAFQGSTFVAEFSDVIRLLRNPAKGLFSGVRNYLSLVRKNGRKWGRRSRRDAERALAETWLEYQFGWKPLLNDIDDMMYILATEYRKGLHEREWATGVGEDMGLVRKSTDTSWLYYPPNPRVCKRRIRYYSKVVYTANLGYMTNSPPVRNLGFTPREWLPALWELLPWSFLVDYFTNIGEIISALSYVGSDVNFVNKTTIRVIYEDSQMAGFAPTHSNQYWYETSPPTVKGSLGALVFTGQKVDRAVYDGMLVPTLRFHTPGSSLRWLNIAALGRLNQEALVSIGHAAKQRLPKRRRR